MTAPAEDKGETPLSPALPPRQFTEPVDNMAIYGHLVVVKNAKVSDLKTHLSAYLARVRKGETVVVCDRLTPIARLVPYEDHPGGLTVLPPSRPRSELRKVRAVRPRRPVDVVELLREDRDQR